MKTRYKIDKIPGYNIVSQLYLDSADILPIQFDLKKDHDVPPGKTRCVGVEAGDVRDVDGDVSKHLLVDIFCQLSNFSRRRFLKGKINSQNNYFRVDVNLPCFPS